MLLESTRVALGKQRERWQRLCRSHRALCSLRYATDLSSPVEESCHGSYSPPGSENRSGRSFERPLSATRAQSSGWKRSTSAPPRRSAGDAPPPRGGGGALSREMLKEVFLFLCFVGDMLLPPSSSGDMAAALLWTWPFFSSAYLSSLPTPSARSTRAASASSSASSLVLALSRILYLSQGYG